MMMELKWLTGLRVVTGLRGGDGVEGGDGVAKKSLRSIQDV
jgi:hypothetical protein